MPTLRSPLGSLLLVAIAACAGPKSAREAAPLPEPVELSAAVGQEQWLAAGEVHRYRLRLPAGTFVRLAVDQQQVDLTAKVEVEGGAAAVTYDHALTQRWPESVPLAGSQDSTLIVSVAPFAELQGPASYRLSFADGPRPAHAGDAERAEAGRLVALYYRHAAWTDELSQQVALALDRLLPHLADPSDFVERITALVILGERRGSAGDRVGAEAALEQALGALSQLEASEGGLEAQVHNDLGMIAYDRGLREAARAHFLAALQRSIDSENGGARRTALINLAVLERDLGEYDASLAHYEEARRLARASGDPRDELAALDGLARSAVTVGETEPAEDLAKKALAQARAAGDRVMEANALHTLSRVARSRDLLPEARSLLQESCALLSGPGLEARLDDCQSALALALHDLGQHAEAARLDSDLLARYQAAKLPLLEATVRFNLGTVQLDQGFRAESLATCTEALGEFEDLGNVSGQASARQCRARALLALGRLAEARAEAESSLLLVDDLRARLSTASLQTSYAATKASYRETLTEILMRLAAARGGAGYAEEALLLNDQARARTLVDALPKVVDGLRKEIDPEHGKAQDALLAEIRGLEDRLRLAEGGSDSDAEVRDLRIELRQRVDRFERNEEALRRRDPRFGELTAPRRASLRMVQRELLDRDTALLFYALGDERSFVWLVSPASFTWAELAGRKRLEELVREALRLIAESRDPSLEAKLERQLSAVADALLSPVADRLGGERLVIVPDGVLHYLPFAALPLRRLGEGDGTGSDPPYLVQRFEIVSLPSISLLSSLRAAAPRRPPPTELLAAVGDPVLTRSDPRLAGVGPDRASGESASDARSERTALEPVEDLDPLPYAAGEVEEILELAPSGQAFGARGFEATRDTVMGERLTRVRLIHFASHGVLNERFPERSRIVLSQFDAAGRPRDGSLSLLDVYRLRLAADLVVVSSCKSALGRDVRGEGIVGLARGFFFAGAKSTVVSLWDVSDRGTAELMTRFYRYLLREHLPRAAALRKAQLSMLGEARFRPPVQWAGFTLQGDWQ